MATTPNLGLDKPDVGSTGWGTDVNDNWDTIDGLAIEAITGLIESPSNKGYTLDLSAAYDYSIVSLTIQTASGTCTAKLTINGTDVTSISSVSVSSSETTATATAANSVAAGDTVKLIISSASSPADLQFTVKLAR